MCNKISGMNYEVIPAPDVGPDCVRLVDSNGNGCGVFVNRSLAQGALNLLTGNPKPADRPVSSEFRGYTQKDAKILDQHRRSWGCPKTEEIDS